MPFDDRSSQSPVDRLDTLSPDQLRRFQLWRAVSSLAQAQPDGRLTADQARLLEALADNLQQLSEQLTRLAALGEQLRVASSE
ncbi:MAG: hypothetical protein U0893_14915 [Chloroflexota bacterium]